MPLSDAAMLVGANAIRLALGGAKAHTDNPGTGGAANASSAAMVVPAWTTPDADGDFDLAANLNFSGGTPNGPCTWVSLWSNTTGSGIWYGNFALSGDLTFDATGSIAITSLALNGSSS